MSEGTEYVDFFAELDGTAEPNDHVRTKVPEDLRGIYWSNTPPISLPNEKLFYHCRVPRTDFERIRGHPFFEGKIVGQDWQELWSRPYVFRDHVFFVSVDRRDKEIYPESEFVRIRVPIASVRRLDQRVENVARPRGIFAGDTAPEFPIGLTSILDDTPLLVVIAPDGRRTKPTPDALVFRL